MDALCKRFRIDNSKREKHSALIDCELLSKVYINLIDQKEPIFQFKNEKEKNEFKKDTTKTYSKKVVEITKNEFKKHQEFLKKEFKRNFF